MWKNVVVPGRPQMTTWRMHIACWVPKATKANSEFVILIAFPLHVWLLGGASMFCCLLCLYLHPLLGPRTGKQCISRPTGTSRPTTFRKTMIQRKINLLRVKHVPFFSSSQIWKILAAFAIV
jgi:hypothetical protein